MILEEASPLLDDQEQNIDAEENYATENDKYLASLNQEEIDQLKKEIAEKINPATITFLKNRHNTKASANEKNKSTVSKFKASRKTGPPPDNPSGKKFESPKPHQVPPSPPPVVQEMLDQLEVLDEFPDRSEQEKYNRLATQVRE
ncbi:RPAP1-like protein [Necator americanus]|uniref:RPAP1-like protein n=1 Tax=Necator americanus TaxID=51031 RepID=W2TVE4_NECAM|nr:RPAP1-like protein [Necator americanus]ETN86075.1 RPAP1-like protein [Necator americanus]